MCLVSMSYRACPLGLDKEMNGRAFKALANWCGNLLYLMRKTAFCALKSNTNKEGCVCICVRPVNPANATVFRALVSTSFKRIFKNMRRGEGL